MVLSLKMHDRVRDYFFFTLLLGNLYNYDLRMKAHFLSRSWNKTGHFITSAYVELGVVS